MRALLVIAAVFALGIFVGRDFWPKSHPDPGYHLRFHRGKMPFQEQAVQQPAPQPTPTPIQHGRVFPGNP